MRFYRALADMRKVTLGAEDPQHLYDEVCRIAVESGEALMAWVGLAAGDMITPVAWAGPADEYTRGLAFPLDRAAQGREVGPTAYAMTHGRAYVCNDFSGDDCTKPWQERASRFGVGASLAFPFGCAGQIVGVLNLYFRTPGSCDAALVEVVDLMASDLGYALDFIRQQSARRDAEMNAREHEARLTNIVEVALEAVIVINGDFRVVVFNRAASQMFRVSVADALGKPLDQFIPEQHRAGHHLHVADFAATGKTSRQMGHVRCVQARRSDGSIFPIEASISRVVGTQGILLTVMIRDVTKIKEAEQAHMAQATAEAASRAKTEFLSRISHELRTPLNAVLGFAQLMSFDRTDPATARQKERLGHILKAGKHLCTLIDETLDVTRIESGRMPIEAIEIDLETLLDSVVDMSIPQAMQGGIHIDSAYRRAGSIKLCADPARLKQVLINLLSNGIKYNRPGGWVRIETSETGGKVSIVIRDGGLGMTPRQLGSLFDPFNRLGRESSEVPGTGLGLVLAKKLVELMGGHLDIDSEAGVGTSASVTLPRHTD